MGKKDEFMKWEKPILTILSSAELNENVLANHSGGSSGPPPGTSPEKNSTLP